MARGRLDLAAFARQAKRQMIWLTHERLTTAAGSPRADCHDSELRGMNLAVSATSDRGQAGREHKFARMKRRPPERLIRGVRAVGRRKCPLA